jgi:hypothetical protein
MKLSVDMGHEDVKLFDGSELLKLPAVLGEPQGDLLSANDREEIETEAGHWYVGQTALSQSINKITGKDEQWAFSPEYLALLLYGLSQYVSAETDALTVDLALSLPIADYRRNRPALTKIFQRAHLVKRPRRRALVINIRSLVFLPQGFAPAKQYLTANNTVAALDLGSRNINFVTIERGKLIDGKTDSVEGGATQVLVDIGKRIEQATKRELNIHQIAEAIQNKKVRAFGLEVDVADIINERLRYYERAIESLVSKNWGNVAALDKLVVFGGGALLVGDKLTKKYSQAVVADNPQFATVIAQYDYLKRKVE